MKIALYRTIKLYKIVILLLGAMAFWGVHGISANAEEAPLAVLYSASDFQNPNGHEEGLTELKKITNKIFKAGYTKVTEALICGDYNASDDRSTEVTEQGIEKIKMALQEQWGLEYGDIYFVQGNHDPSSAENIDDTGGTDREYYSVYQINYHDFSMKMMDYINEEERLIDASKDLKEWLVDKVREQYKKPIFIITHLPLHNTYRYDNTYSEHLFDVINEAAGQGLNIIYLFGHNHSKEYDSYLGGDAIYLTKGDEINIPDVQGNSASDYKTEKLEFTYINAGYLSKPTEDLLSSCVFEIFEDKIRVSRYTSDGICNLKDAGISSEDDFGWNANETIVESSQVIELNDIILSVRDLKNEIYELTLDVSQSINLEISSKKCKAYNVVWKSTDSEVAKVIIDDKDSTKATVIGLKYGITMISASVNDLEVCIPVFVMPENAKKLSHGDNVRFYSLKKDISADLQMQSDISVEYMILNRSSQGYANAFAVQDNELVATEEIKIIYVPGIGEVVTPKELKNVLWNFEKVEDSFGETEKYYLKMSEKSPYRYRYYISPTKEVDSTLEGQNINKMRLYSSKVEDTAAVFMFDAAAEEGLALVTSSYYRDGIKQNEKGTFTLCYDEVNHAFVLDNVSECKGIYFYKRSDKVISDVIFWTKADTGIAYVNSEKMEETGGTIRVMYEDIIEEVPITLEMLTGYEEEPGVYNCNVTFNGEIVSEKYELTLKNDRITLPQWMLVIQDWFYNLFF